MGIFFWDRTNQPTLSGCIYGDISQRIQGGSLRMQSCYMGLSTRKLWESPISSTGSFMFISFSLIGPIQIAILRLPFGGASHLTFLMFQHVSIVSIFQPERLFFFCLLFQRTTVVWEYFNHQPATFWGWQADNVTTIVATGLCHWILMGSLWR